MGGEVVHVLNCSSVQYSGMNRICITGGAPMHPPSTYNTLCGSLNITPIVLKYSLRRFPHIH